MSTHRHADGTEAEGIACGACIGTPAAARAPRVTSGPVTEHRIPRTFYDDHVARDLPAGTVVKETKSHYTVELDAAEKAELLSDAEHYAWLGTAELGPESLGLVSSARATAKILKAAGE